VTAIRTARPDERDALEALQLRASSASGTYAAQLRDHPDAIEIPLAQLEAGLVRVADQDGCVAGFAVLLPAADGGCELDGIFVEPDRMGAGIGRLLIDDAVAIARERGARRIDVVANPDAVGFYERLGFEGGEDVPTRFGPARRMRLRVS
jgi:GNAT superfamily N-acetyltransferase